MLAASPSSAPSVTPSVVDVPVEETDVVGSTEPQPVEVSVTPSPTAKAGLPLLDTGLNSTVWSKEVRDEVFSEGFWLGMGVGILAAGVGAVVYLFVLRRRTKNTLEVRGSVFVCARSYVCPCT